MRSPISWMAALCLAVAACTAEALPLTTTTLETSTTSTLTSSTSTTSTTEPAGPASHINGMPVTDPEAMERRVLAVKIDNHPKSLPQSGIENADMVIELMVEGITRFLTLWHESDSEYLGPMRSGRPTDGTILAALNEPTFAISGAQRWVQSAIAARGINLIGEVGSPATFRIGGRPAPHDLYVDTLALRAHADDRGYPDEGPDGPLWEFGDMPEEAKPVSTVRIDFSGNNVTWEWDRLQRAWLRSAYGGESFYRDEEGVETRIGVPVLVALYVDQYTASPPSGSGGTGLPGSKTVGSGHAFVFADGKVMEGTWERESEEEWFTLLDADGETLSVPPGKVWVSLVPSHRGLTYE